MRNIFLLLATLTMIAILSGWTVPVQAASVWEPGFDAQVLDSYVEGQMSKHGIKGISVAVTEGTDIAYLKGYGTARDDHPMTPHTPMYIGSQSKSFTGLAIAQLIELGKIDPNDPVQTYLPWFKVADSEASKQITVNHLLHHTSGLSESGFTAILPENASAEDAVRTLASAQLTAPVGAKHQYFNYGYVVLTVIIEEVTGQSYEEYVQQHIFEGWSVKYMGWGLLVFVLALGIFQTRNLFLLCGWVARSREWSTAKVSWDVASNFLIPTIILIVVFSQIKAYFGYRFNLTYQLINMSCMLTDITILMIVGSVPDHLQGFVKLFWILSEKTRKA